MTGDKPLSPAEVAKLILDDATPKARREALVEGVGIAGRGGDPGDGRRPARERCEGRVSPHPVGLARRRRRRPGERRESARRSCWTLSLPKKGEPLRDWQAVVLGGGVINGLSLEGKWPRQRIAELVRDNPELERRWAETLKLSHAMADNEKTPTGTRYDALRIVALDAWRTPSRGCRSIWPRTRTRSFSRGRSAGSWTCPCAEPLTKCLQMSPCSWSRFLT